ncbi:type I restriction enzyme R subunit [Saccharopolyspora erythraea NRRL 2338]|uniref:Type I site-specific restriction-modification system (HsdR) n=2 Tax=Saccharopolyspora erythraea TaxID=1836 RepID=A4F831_SACEN|nr:type I restriction endonuclease [Saccharopolyspora erythraea]EQD86099.1 type I restriction endonuclease subunit R [Saccharopolyspora erythraea D]PFG94003.1 type I restriction enzyme R subunit [Saccharopolyspora erythraea NRRL 2338]QRK90811.1 type I restriction endonuclease subunit R [Saccharopolyspora erythraea]CAM00206.1 putative type I site-specific restriction-modification system (HsdR) [Saccharopolyspora erythraea NRRL 2338]
MSPIHHEAVFGTAIVDAMLERGWEEGAGSDYDAELGLDTAQLFTFIGATQQAEWDELLSYYGDDADAAQRGFAQRVAKAIDNDGVLEVLRKGVKDRSVRIRLAYFKPSLVVSDSALDDYRANRLTIVRELKYAAKQADRDNRLDLTLFVNGVPVATAELKNPLTGQGVEHAKRQYREERDPTELIFRNRVVANFAVDPDLVFVATELRGERTRFLPFNTGSDGPGKPGGAGNPPTTQFGKYATSYLWEQVWQPDNWLDLLERFVHEYREKSANGRIKKSLIFPRYHQWDVVKKITAHTARHGTGHDYLVMASAGSGKSNTIAWLAYRLSSLHTPADPAELDADARAKGLKPGSPVFDKVLIITDRRNLDSQLRATVGSFEQTAGTVVAIDEKNGSKSEQLAKRLSSSQGKIITVTLQTFPALLDFLRKNPTEIKGSRFAIVVDEAHSSQSGDAAGDVRKALRNLALDADDDSNEPGATEAKVPADDLEAKLKRRVAERAKNPNLSYFAFTATPKSKTLEYFGTLGERDGKAAFVPFHTYSMRQAIEEGFILDPLRNYVTYNTYWKLISNNPDDREVDAAKANPQLARAAVMHPSTVSQHAQVIVDHFRAHTLGRLGGRAKAMVVTASRQSAVQMSRAIKNYIADLQKKGKLRDDIGVLVAFSGTLTYENEEVTESKENGGLPETALTKAFAYTRADDLTTKTGGAGQPEYRILVVAEKYQTGFDQPLLTTMYVNKKLGGISAVQTLSRLNRTADRKTQADLAVLDFVNEAGEIQESFRPYFEDAATLPSDPNLLYNAQGRVMSPPILVDTEMIAFVEAFLAAEQASGGSEAKWAKLHAELYRHIAPAVQRYEELLRDETLQELAEQFRFDLGDFIRKYGFLSQIVPYQDAELERLYLFGRHLLNRLPHGNNGGVDIGEVDLSHLRVEKTGEHDLGLAPDGTAELRGFGDGSGTSKNHDKSLLSELIERFNDRHATTFTEDDVARPFRETVQDEKVRQAAIVNNEENFGAVFDDVFEDKMADHIDTISGLGDQYFARSDDTFKKSLNRSARSAAWRLIRKQEGIADDVA